MNMAVTHPGDVLSRQMEEHNLTEAKLADDTGLSRALVSQILRGNRRITPSTALLLARYFGTEPEFWLEDQERFDLAEAEKSLSERLAEIVPISKN